MLPFIEYPVNINPLSNRTTIFGIGINDASYLVRIKQINSSQVCPYYQRWQGMLERCYSPAYKKLHPTYNNCTVIKDWLLFTNFKNWMQKQDWKGKQLDKDILTPGNKIYSPNTCVFVKQDLNNLLVSRINARGKYPQGVYRLATNKNYIAQYNLNGKRIYLGYFNTIQNASKAYNKAKSKHLIRIAYEQSDNRIKKGLIRHAHLLHKNKLC